ncbi:MAG: heme NO-binding domain-containing protein [Myxococcota bacterium]
MKGVVFNLLESFVVEGWGEEVYEDVLALCPLKTKEPFVGPGTYPDSDLFSIATKTAEKLDLPLADALRAFGTYCFPKLAATAPELVAASSTARELLLSVDAVIHVEVRKLMPEALTPSFDYEAVGDDLLIRYYSKRKLCRFMEGLLDGLAEHFQTTIHHQQQTCMHDGAPYCEFRIQFAGVNEAAA